MHLLVSIPALNEEQTVSHVIDLVPQKIDGVTRTTILVVDDGSTDNTAAVAVEAGACVVSHACNCGVGAAFQTAVREAVRRGADILVTIDGDGQFDAADIPQLVAPILHGSVGLCTASRFADAALIPQMPGIKIWGNHRVASIVSALAGEQFHDVSCGFRAYSRDAILRITPLESFTYTHEVLLDLAAKRVAIREIPLAVRGTREFGESRVASNVWRYAVRTLSIMARFYRDHYPLKLCSTLASVPLVAACVLLAISGWQWWQTEVWLKSFAFAGASLIGVSLALMFFGFLAGVTNRLRRNQEEILYWLRLSATREAATTGGDTTAETPIVPFPAPARSQDRANRASA
jgi:glycosyltransferase involved in cell wall biosynthesis